MFSYVSNSRWYVTKARRPTVLFHTFRQRARGTAARLEALAIALKCPFCRYVFLQNFLHAGKHSPPPGVSEQMAGEMLIKYQCDSCYRRKIKCDRQDPCMNCVDAGSDCCRTRRKQRRTRQNNISLPAFQDGSSRLEGSAPISSLLGASSESQYPDAIADRQHILPTGIMNSFQHYPSAHGEDRTTNTHIPKSSTTSHEAEERPRQGLPQESIVHGSEATRFLRREIETKTQLSQERSMALKSALDFLNQLHASTGPFQPSENARKLSIDAEALSSHFTPEVYYMMAIDTNDKYDSKRRFFWPDHISLSTLHTMSLALLEGHGDEQTINYFRICTFTKAIFFVARSRELSWGQSLRSHLKESQTKYESVVLASLSQINMLATPTMLLAQALLSGALLIQFRGDMFQSWTLTAFASRVLVFLNYHTTQQKSVPTEKEKDIRMALVTCYYLDKILSMLLARPASLPKLNFNPSEYVHLDPDMPLSAIMKAVVGFAQVQEKTADLFQNNHKINVQSQVRLIDELLQEIQDVHAGLQKQRSQFPFSELEVEWIAVDFSYFAISTSLLHLNPISAKGPFIQKQCLEFARKALVSLKEVQRKISPHGEDFDSQPYFLIWTMLKYPLCPFFVLFCNVVYTSNVDDYFLMKEITEWLLPFVKATLSVAKLYRMFSMFLSLCSPLVRDQFDLRRQHLSLDATANDFNFERLNTKSSGGDNFSVLQNVSREHGERQKIPENENWVEGVTWNDNMLSLFDCQPWLGWIESSYLSENLPVE